MKKGDRVKVVGCEPGMDDYTGRTGKVSRAPLGSCGIAVIVHLDGKRDLLWFCEAELEVISDVGNEVRDG